MNENVNFKPTYPMQAAMNVYKTHDVKKPSHIESILIEVLDSSIFNYYIFFEAFLMKQALAYLNM